MGWSAARAVRRRARRIVNAPTAAVSARHGAAVETPSDLVATLRSAHDPASGQRLTSREIENNVTTFIGAGSDTVSAALTWSIFLLSQAPEIREAVEAEVDACTSSGPLAPAMLKTLVWTQAVIEEALRLYPPAPMIGRRALAEDVLGGERFPSGTTVVIAPWVVHRHERLWEAPDFFRPERFLPDARGRIPRFAYLPFGAGPRVCIGMGFALQETIVLLTKLLQRLRFERVDDRPISLRQCMTIQPREKLAMRITRRRGAV
jgi:cytochrome P450